MRFWFLFFLFLIIGCQDGETPSPAAPDELTVLTRTGLTVYTEDKDKSPSGFDYDLVKAFADEEGLKLKVTIASNGPKLLKLLQSQKATMAAAWLDGHTPPQGLRKSQAYLLEKSILVSGGNYPVIRNLQQLSHKTIHVLSGSSQALFLQTQLKTATIVPVESEHELLTGIAEKRFELAAMDESTFAIGSNFYPDIEEVLELEHTTAISWFFAPNTPESLITKANEFLARAQKNGLIARLKDRYFGHVSRLTPEAVGLFITHIHTKLGQYRALFQSAQIKTDIDWRLLAALAYQESGWNPLATSPTGVRGIMMLTERTADHFGVSNRLDPAQSIHAGARYLAELRQSLPDNIEEPDRLWLALAGYNLGQGHLRAARNIARTVGLDPDAWYSLKKALPLLAKPEYYGRLKSGKGRGGEAVIMAENIRLYYDILSRYEPPYRPFSDTKEKSP